MNNLRTLRKALKQTQTDIATYLGITVSAYGNYELGQREPDISTLNKLADYFGVTVDYLLGRPDTTQTPDPDLQRLLSVWHSLSDTAKMRLLAYADGLKDND